MKFTLSWLKEHLDLPETVTLDTLVEAMTMAGLEVESVDDPAARLSAFTVAHVLEAEPHPDADKLRVCTVETIDGVKQIVCGAPNARKGLVGIYAPLGTFIPGLDFALDKKPRKIRGVESHGMLCSAKELEAGEDEDGIVDLPDRLAVGTPAAQALGVNDPMIDFEVTPNRPDWLGVAGIARDLAACGLGQFDEPGVDPVAGTFACPVAIATDDETACPVFMGRVIRGVKNGPSPDWLQAKLKSIGLRPINRLVDVTNLISYDRARPLHVYDVAKLTGTVRARLGRSGESFEALDGKTYAVDETMCVIADEARVLGLGGVMGGTYSGSEDDTSDVLIEAAYFDPLRTARTGRATGIQSDAQYRFARGIDPASCEDGLELATRLILDMCGGEPSEVVVAGKVPNTHRVIDFDPGQVKRLTGMDVSDDDTVTILEALGCQVSAGSKGFVVLPPSWRGDLEQSADLVEEVARCHGFDKLPDAPTPKPRTARAPVATLRQQRRGLARRALAVRGYSETVTWSFVRRDQAALFGGGDNDALILSNPISSELDTMRPSALIHLLLSAQKNADMGLRDIALFEVGPIYAGDAPSDQETVISGVLVQRPVRHWQGKASADALTAKADAVAALAAAGAPVERLQVEQGARGWWHPGRSGTLRLGPNVLAEFGEVHPKTLRALDVEGPVLAFEVFLDRVPEPKAKKGQTKARPMADLPDLMPLTRDFAFVVSKSVSADQVARAARGAFKGPRQALFAGAEVFDVFEGGSLADDEKSLAVEVSVQPRGETLKDKDIEAISADIIAAVTKATGGRLR